MANYTRKSVCLFLSELIIIFGVAVTSISMRKFLTPYKRGFFRDDQSLMHPFHPSTVTDVMLYTVGFLGSGAVIIIIEGVLIKLQVRRMSNQKFPCLLVAETCYKMIALFAFGAAITHLVTNVAKYAVGRLRPHFFDVCQPNWTLLNDTSGYIEADICTGSDKSLITEARVSFPSGHSSISMYCATYISLYLYKRFTWKGIVFIRPLMQVAAFCMALYTGLSRISDNKHHGTDVLAGSIIGVVMGFIAIFRISDLFHRHSSFLTCVVRDGLPVTYIDGNGVDGNCTDWKAADGVSPMVPEPLTTNL